MVKINLVGLDFDRALAEMVNIPEGVDITVIFSDGSSCVMRQRVLWFHLIYWKVMHIWKLPITQQYIMDLSVVTYNTFSKFGTLILNSIRVAYPDSYRACIHDFAWVMNTINNLTISHCQEYHKSLSIVDLMKIDKDPEVKAITNDRIVDANISIMDAESQFKTNVSKLFSRLKIPGPNNAMSPFVNLNFVNEVAVAHIFYQVGFRTDVDDSIIRYPVKGNYLNGLQDYVEYILEALSAKKSVFYNKEAIPFADYFGRRQHLLLSCLPHLYRCDCGTDQYITTDVISANKNSLLFKNIIDGSRLVTLDHSNIDSYVGKTIKMRSPMGCRYTNGVCEVCGGALLASISDGVHIGIYTALQFTEILVQVILSSKHLQRLTSMPYLIPPDLGAILMKVKGGIFLKPKIVSKMKGLRLVFNTAEAIRLTNVNDLDLRNVETINETAFGQVTNLMLMKNDDPMTDIVNLEVNEHTPRYSRELIKYISDNPDRVELRDKLFIVDITKFPADQPLFKIIPVNMAMASFVKSAERLLEVQIVKYTSANELYHDFSSLVRTQVKMNSAYLEMVLRAAMVTSGLDVRPPSNIDIDNVSFGTNDRLNFERSIGTLTAFEQLPKMASNPLWYLKPKIYTRFDDFLNLKMRS